MSEAKQSSKASYPRLAALGWDRDDPTLLIKKGLQRLEEESDKSAAKVEVEIEATRQAASRSTP